MFFFSVPTRFFLLDFYVCLTLLTLSFAKVFTFTLILILDSVLFSSLFSFAKITSTHTQFPFFFLLIFLWFFPFLDSQTLFSFYLSFFFFSALVLSLSIPPSLCHLRAQNSSLFLCAFNILSSAPRQLRINWPRNLPLISYETHVLRQQTKIRKKIILSNLCFPKVLLRLLFSFFFFMYATFSCLFQGDMHNEHSRRQGNGMKAKWRRHWHKRETLRLENSIDRTMKVKSAVWGFFCVNYRMRKYMRVRRIQRALWKGVCLFRDISNHYG